MIDVAERAGVSHSTVSRVLSGSVGVHAETSEAVRAAIEELGYVVNKGARRLAGGRSNIVGVVVHDIENAYSVAFVAAIEQELAHAGYSMLLASARGKEPSPQLPIAQVVQQNICDGLILLFSGYEQFFTSERSEQIVPIVLIGSPRAGVADTIQVDNRGGTDRVVEHLAALGHRRIAHISGRIGAAAAQERFEAFRSKTAELGLDTDRELLKEGDFTESTAYRVTRELLALEKPPTAIVASADTAAAGVLSAIQEAGLQAPRDLSVVGFDDLTLAQQTRPRLTTVRQPLEQIAKQSLDRLLARIENPDQEFTRTRIATELIVRESTGRPPASR